MEVSFFVVARNKYHGSGHAGYKKKAVSPGRDRHRDENHEFFLTCPCLNYYK